MFTTIQIFSLLGSLIFGGLVIAAVRRRKLQEAYAILWVFTSIVMIIVSVWTKVLKLISDIIGIVYPPATLFLIILVGILLILLQFSIVLSAQHAKIMRLAQELALLKENKDK